MNSPASDQKTRKMLNAPAHTPGPWRTWTRREAELPDFVTVAEVDGIYIGSCEDLAQTWGDPEDDARLIAAAPDMFRVLRLLVAPFDGAKAAGLDLEETTITSSSKMLANIRAAIAKVEGK